jgi:hypothetical protein
VLKIKPIKDPDTIARGENGFRLDRIYGFQNREQKQALEELIRFRYEKTSFVMRQGRVFIYTKYY